MARPLDRLALNDQGFAFDPDQGESYTINSTGRTVIDGLRQGKSPVSIAMGLAAEHALQVEMAERDVLDFIDQLRRLGLVGGAV